MTEAINTITPMLPHLVDSPCAMSTCADMIVVDHPIGGESVMSSLYA